MSGIDGFVHLENGQRLYYQSIGEGSQTVIIPAAHYLAADLDNLRSDDRHLLFYDQRGRGGSDPVKEESLVWLDYEMDDIEAIREYFGIAKLSLIGWSYLGAVTALYAHAYPQFVDRLVLMCPVAIRSEAEYMDEEAEEKIAESRMDHNALQKLKEMLETGLNKSAPEEYCREDLKAYLPRQMGKPEALSRMQSNPCKYENEYVHHLSEHWKKRFPAKAWKHDWRDIMSRMKTPSLVIHGGEDLNPVESAEEWVKTLPCARLLLISGSGHFPHLEDPDIFFPAVDVFLGGDWPEGSIEI